jgi:hypothetical protein
MTERKAAQTQSKADPSGAGLEENAATTLLVLSREEEKKKKKEKKAMDKKEERERGSDQNWQDRE